MNNNFDAKQIESIRKIYRCRIKIVPRKKGFFSKHVKIRFDVFQKPENLSGFEYLVD